ncbi:PilZ domain-containing protein [Psychromonas aquimarina]|uniref:PilZ domain-containing protein n=1 Tax=Psychromonas aquimarina TaxID=444919 RepID=UPI0004000F6D|nr:PilZ domain-containing protein [Psychromonas aquimarina]
MTTSEYFLVNYQLAINVELLDTDENIPDSEQFEAEIPAPFRMASDLASIDSHQLHSLKLNNETTQALWGFLQAQNQKINTLLSYVLSQQDQPEFHYQTSAFSAGCCCFDADSSRFSTGRDVRLKIFIPEESAAVYCYASVSSNTDNNIKLTYQQLREEDRELLIRTALHIQSKQLKLRAAQRALSQ